MRDITIGESFDHGFTTIASTGAPTTLLGTPTVAAYPSNSLTEITAGITLTVDFDARTGLNNVRVVATIGNGYADATDYKLVITAGTVDGVSVVGYVIAHFSIGRAAAHTRLGAPAGASVSADIAAIEAQTDDIGAAGAGLTAITALLPAALVGGRIDASVGAMAAGVVTAAAVATGAIDADALAADAVTEIRSLASGTADSGTTTTMVDAARTEADTDYWKGCFVLFTSGTLAGQVRLVTAFDPVTDTVTFAPATTQAVATHTYEILPAARVDLQLWLGSVVNALVSGRMDASVGAMAADVVTAAAVAPGAIDAATFAAGAIDAAAIATDAIGAAEFAQAAADKVWASAARSLTDKVGFALSAAGIQAIWDALTSALIAVGSIGKLIVDNLNATITSRASQASVDALPTAAGNADAVWDEARAGHVTAGTFGQGLASVQGNVTGSVASVTGAVGSVGADGITAASLAADVGTELADALLKRDMSAVAGEAARSPLNALRALRNKTSIDDATLTVTKEDDVTTAWTAAVTTDAAANPVTAVDPI